MTTPTPQQPYLRSGKYGDEIASFTDFNALLKFFATKTLRASLTSPPLAKDVEELTFVYDRTLNRLYTKCNGSLKYVAFS
jgi:hypothetical protein